LLVKYALILVSVAAALAQAPPVPPPPQTAVKVALVNLEQAMVLTTDGQNAEKKLNAQFSPRKAAIEEKHKELADLQDKIDKGGMSDEERQKLIGDVNEKSEAVDRETTQADADLSVAQKNVLRELGPKLLAVVTRYAKEHGYDVVFDISSSEAPRLYADNAQDITKEVIDEYEKSYAGVQKPAPKKK
jgi:Skp family chaperone for outer membrane proteins